ncbi:MAG TPA: transporter [Mesorhizobium sp.]
MKSALVIAPFTFLGLVSAGFAQEHDADELAKKLANPISSLISVPFQNNFDFGAGPDGDGFHYYLNVQPVIPIKLNEDWNLISRTILPINYADYLPESNEWGLGDTEQSFFLSPSKPGPGGLIWGVGPVILLPTATDDFFGSNQWSVGPTAVALVQKDQWTVGMLANHIWSLGSDDDASDVVNETFLQPFLNYSLGHGRSLSLDTESTYDWEVEEWTVPINFGFQQVLKLGHQPVQLELEGRYYAAKPEGGPDWGLRAQFTLLFPDK